MRLLLVISALCAPVLALAANGPTTVSKKASGAKKDEKKPAEKADTKPDLPKLSPSGEKESTVPTMPAAATDGGTPATAKTDVSPEKKAQPKYFEGMGRTPEEQKHLEEITEALKLYEDESREFKREVQLLVEK